MRKIRTVATFGLLVVLATLLNLMTGSLDRTGRPLPGWMLMSPVPSTMDLTAEQKSQIRRRYISFQKEVAPILFQKVEKERVLRSLGRQNRPDRQKMKSLGMEIDDLKWQLAEKYTNYHLTIENILTSEPLPGYGAIP